MVTQLHLNLRRQWQVKITPGTELNQADSLATIDDVTSRNPRHNSAREQSSDQADADLLCKLRTGSPTSVASTFSIGLTVAAPGFSCPWYAPQLPNMVGRGVNVPMFYTEDSLDTHGGGASVTNVVCTP